MFQVDPDRVLLATGRPKIGDAEQEITNEEEDVEADAEGEGAVAEKAEEQLTDAQAEEVHEDEQDPRKILKQLATQAKAILSASQRLSARRKQDLRAFQKSVKKTLSRPTSSEIQTENLEDQFAQLKALIEKPKEDSTKPAREPSSDSKEVTLSSTEYSESSSASSDDADLRSIRSALDILYDNPVDEEKPYATPWQPRDYMSAFAFIPRYLEVNQNICTAVYLRHPVARPGLAEVPTPFSEYVNSSAFAWYLRRR